VGFDGEHTHIDKIRKLKHEQAHQTTIATSLFASLSFLHETFASAKTFNLFCLATFVADRFVDLA